MDLMDDQELKKSVIAQMMGELDDETGKALKKPSGPVKGVEIAITVSPKSGEEDPEEVDCGEEGCADPDHHHPQDAGDAMPEGMAPEEGDYISQLLKKLG